MITLRQRLELQQKKGRSIAQVICCQMKKHHCQTAEICLSNNLFSAIVYKNGKEFLYFSEKNVSKQAYQYVIQMISAVKEFSTSENEVENICKVTQM